MKMFDFKFSNSEARRITVSAPDEAKARQKAMEHYHGMPEPFGLAAQSGLFPVTPRPKAVYPKEWTGLGLSLIYTDYVPF